MSLDVQVITLAGDEVPVSLTPDLCVRDIKQSIKNSIGIPVERQQLLLDGLPLDDKLSVEQAGISDGQTIQVVYVPIPKQSYNKTITIQPLSGQKAFNMVVNTDSTVGE